MYHVRTRWCAGLMLKLQYTPADQTAYRYRRPRYSSFEEQAIPYSDVHILLDRPFTIGHIRNLDRASVGQFNFRYKRCAGFLSGRGYHRDCNKVHALRYAAPRRC